VGRKRGPKHVKAVRSATFIAVLVLCGAVVPGEPCERVAPGGPDDCNGNGFSDGCDVGPHALGYTWHPVHTLACSSCDPAGSFITPFDIDGDGDGDFVLHLPAQALAFLNRGDETFDEPVSSPGLSPSNVHSFGIDVQGDGIPDLLVRRGDANADGRFDISDGIHTLHSLFLGGPRGPCRAAADANDSGTVDISDAIGTFQNLFLGGPRPPAPGPNACGKDPTPDSLSCVEFPPCAEAAE